LINSAAKVLQIRQTSKHYGFFFPYTFIIYYHWPFISAEQQDYPFALIYINKVTKRQIFDEKTDKMFAISDF
jgi:hypothetical protein